MAQTGPGPRFVRGRRAFLPALLQEALVTLGMMRGGQGYRLAELEELTDEQMAAIRPVVNPAYEILVQEDQVCARHKSSGLLIQLFAVDDTASLLAFNQFDGNRRLGTVGARLSEELGWEAAQGFAHARTLFLRLVRDLVCIPHNAPPSHE